jgi:two-component system LytT family sensor kinase
MDHPITNSRRNLVIYSIFWLLIALMHGMFFYSFFGASIQLAVLEGLFYALIYGFIGLGLWYAVRYSQMETHQLSNLILNHVAAFSITIVLLSLLTYQSIKVLPIAIDGYGEFFNRTLVWRVFTAMVAYILIVLVYYVIMYYANFVDRINKESEIKTSVKVAELDALKSQINPHFLFNSLNSISALAGSKSEEAREMIAKLSDFLRVSIAEKPDAMRPFTKELENIGRYLDIEKVRFGEKLSVKHDIAKKCDEARIPSLILQPIVENAIKHGLNESLEKVEIRIVADCFHGFLKVQVENDFDDDRPNTRAGTGLGLQNISQRMKLLYGRDDLLRVAKEKKKYIVTLAFPQTIADD